MNSFTLWCDGNKETKVNITMHFNLWIEYDFKDNTPFLDVGVMVENLEKSISKINLFVPFLIQKEDLVDLGSILSSDSKLTGAIFNEYYKLTIDPRSKKVTVMNDNENIAFYIYSIDIDNDLAVYQRYKGSIVCLDVSKLKCKNNQRQYFRIRIKSKKLNDIVQSYKSKNEFFESAISLEKFIDFRFNDIRSLELSLLQKINNTKCKTVFNKVHFFLLTRADVELFINNSTERLLEKEIWRNYICFTPKTNIVASHVKLEDHFVVYAKMKIKRCNWYTILTYLVIFAIITIGLNLASSALFSLVSKSK